MLHLVGYTLKNNILTLTTSQLNRQIYHCKLDLFVNQTSRLYRGYQ
jgi:hypothetical protein